MRATSVMLLFISKKYFGSRNCLREVRASLEQEKPLILVYEQQEDKGGGPLDVLQAECLNAEMRAKIFDGRNPITWHRISHYQKLTLKHIATNTLRHNPRYSSILDGSEELTLVLPGEINISELQLPGPIVLWCSPGNLGALEVAKELVASLPSVSSNQHSTQGSSSRLMSAVQVVDEQPDVQTLNTTGEYVAMLLLLNKDTWVKHGEVLERDIRAARAAGIKLVMVHENDKSKGGCDSAHPSTHGPHTLPSRRGTLMSR